MFSQTYLTDHQHKYGIFEWREVNVGKRALGLARYIQSNIIIKLFNVAELELF